MQETKFSTVQHIQLARNLTQLKSALCSTTSPVKSWKRIISEMGLCQKNPVFFSLHCVGWFLYLRIQRIWLYTFRGWPWGQEPVALNIPCEVLRQIKYFWGKYQKISLSHALEFPAILRLFLCDLLYRSAHLHLINCTFLGGFPNLGNHTMYLILYWRHTTWLHHRHWQKYQGGDIADTVVPPEMSGFSCSCF